MSPVRFGAALVRFCGALLALAPRLIREARSPDPMTLEPQILRRGTSFEDR